MEELIVSGCLLVATAYLCRLCLPLMASLVWQLSRPLHFWITSKLATPTDSDCFFYLPKNNDPLIFRWYWPNHKRAIPIAFIAGIILGYLGIGLDVNLPEAFHPIVIISGLIVFGITIYKSISNNLDLWVGYEKLMFTAFSIAEMYVGLDVIGLYIGRI